MRHARAFGLAGIAALAAAAAAFAQTTVTPLPEAEPVQTAPIEANAMADLAAAQPGDAQAGAGKAAACAACHGVDGNPADPQYPRIAGQSERYIARQLALFKSGERNTPLAALMQPFAMPLSAQDMRDIGAYYATQTPGAGVADDSQIASGPYAGMKFYQVGERLYRAGDAGRGIPACMACHGPDGRGNPGPPYPNVAGQYADYSARMLEAYRDGLVLGSAEHANSVMAEVAAQLTDEEIQSLASYLEGLHPRLPGQPAAGG
jgi:cytochrome c553